MPYCSNFAKHDQASLENLNATTKVKDVFVTNFLDTVNFSFVFPPDSTVLPPIINNATLFFTQTDGYAGLIQLFFAHPLNFSSSSNSVQIIILIVFAIVFGLWLLSLLLLHVGYWYKNKKAKKQKPTAPTGTGQ
jgi:hypothetical protein